MVQPIQSTDNVILCYLLSYILNFIISSTLVTIVCVGLPVTAILCQVCSRFVTIFNVKNPKP